MFGKKTALVLAGVAAYAYYKYSQLSAEEKEKLMGDLKEKGQKLYDDYVPEDIKNLFAKKEDTQTTGQPSGAANDFVV